MPYSHEENSIVERANREVNKHLRAIVFDRKIKERWSLALTVVRLFQFYPIMIFKRLTLSEVADL